MHGTRVAVVAIALVLSVQIGSAQDLSRYRGYVLESSLESIISASGATAADTKTLHERPAKIQELKWRAPYVTSGSELADPVSGAVFRFWNDALYQVVVAYDRGRTEGLTDGDVIASLTAVYGEPVLTRIRPPAALSRSKSHWLSLTRYFLNDVGTPGLAQWDSHDALLTLRRDEYLAELQLVLMSKTLGAGAQQAIREAERQDAIEAPRRELEQRKKEVADTAAARDMIRATNKAAFRP
jgi:hypothetical protein